MDVGDLLTFGQFSETINGAKAAGQRIHDEGLTVNTATNAVKAVMGGTVKLAGTAFMEGVTAGEAYVVMKASVPNTGLNVPEKRTEAATSSTTAPTRQFSTPASSSINRVNLQKQLASEAQRGGRYAYN